MSDSARNKTQHPFEQTEVLGEDDQRMLLAWTWKTVSHGPGDEHVNWVNWLLIKISGEEGVAMPPLGDRGWPPTAPTSNWRAAQEIASGYQKWDGCHEISLDEHFCDASDRKRVLAAIERAHAGAIEIIGSHWDGGEP